MENTNPAQSTVTTPPSGPGRLLYQARQDLRLAPEDVAQILHLSSKQILALEQDDYKKLPGPTYVRGYLRSYAQLLGLSPEKVLDLYNSLTIPAKPISLPKSQPPPQITSSDRLIKAATLGVVAVVLGLVYLWWRNEEQPLEPAITRSAALNQAPAVEPANAPGATDTTPVSSVAGVMTTPANPLPPATVAEPMFRPGSTDRTPGTAASPAASLAMKSGESGHPVTVSGLILNVTPSEPPKPAETSLSAHNDRALMPARKAVEIPPGMPRSRLVLHAVQESWADIRDARDNKLLYENVPAGRTVTIEGLAPFSVFLGNADGVRVEFNGQNFDVSRYKRGQVARFTLGVDAAAVNN